MTLQTASGAGTGPETARCTQLLSTLDALSTSTIVADMSGRIVGWNDAARDLFGWTAQEVLGRAANEVTDWGLSQTDITRILLSPAPEPAVLEHDVVVADGSRRRIRTVAVHVAGHSGAEREGWVVAAGTPADSDTSERRFQALVERGTDLALICDADVVIRYAGPSLQQLFGYHPDQVVGMSGWDFVHPNDQPATRQRWAAAIATPGQHQAFEVRVRDRAGRWRWVEERITNMLDDPAVGGLVVNIRDVTERREAADQLANRERRFRSILDSAHEGIWVIDKRGRTVYANQRMADIHGVPRDELVAGDVWDFYDPAAQEIVRTEMARRAAGITEHYELPFTRRDGQRRWLLVSAAPLTDDAGTHEGSVGMCVDITDRKQADEELRRLALYDRLTGLPNRTLLADRLAMACEQQDAGHVAVLFCDLDRFKMVNDDRGHDTGDRLLAAAAQRLREVAPARDTVARFGGDEFVVVCPGSDPGQAVELADDILAAFAAPFELDDARLTVGISVGVATTADVAADDLLQAADRALYAAKDRGRGRVSVHDEAMRQSSEGLLQLVADLRDAIDHGALELHYQPITYSNGGRVGVEALLRWQHPRHGRVAPPDVIRLAENNGLIVALGAWTIRQACTDIALLSSHPGLSVAVNLSAHQLLETDIVSTVRSALTDSGLAPSRLTLEVTETALAGEVDVTRLVLQALKELGVRLALDDFGTGYSSLTYLREFPVDALKIDRSFVAGMCKSADDLAIVASLVSLAAALDLDVIAEGVETTDQADALRRLGCTGAQGYLWSPAVPLRELSQLLSRLPAWAPSGGERRGRQSGEPDDVRARILAMHRNGASPATIAAALNADGLTTATGTRWHRNTVARIIAEHSFPGLQLPA